MLQTKIFDVEEDLHLIKPEWNKLLSKTKSNSPFLSWEWISTWVEMLKNKNEHLFLIVVTREMDELVALVPFLKKPEKTLGASFNIIEFIGADERTSADYMDLIVHPDIIDEVTKSLLDYFKNEGANNWDVIKMSGTLKDSAAFNLSRYFSYDGYEVYEELTNVCPFLNLPSTWEEYLSSLSKKSRYNVRKKRRILDGAYKNGFYIIQDAHALEAAINSTAQLHKKRMQMKETKGFSITDDFWAFHLELAKQFFYKDWLFLGILEVNGFPVASQYAFKFDNKIFHYQTGFDPDYNKYSVGLISTGQMIENSIYGGFKEYDFLRGKEDYKYHWANHKREIFSIYIANNNYKGRFFLANQKIIKNLKKRAKNLFG